MTVNFTSSTYNVVSANAANLVAWNGQITTAFIAAGGGNHVLYDTVVVNSTSVYTIVECTINNLGNAFSRFYYRIQSEINSSGFGTLITTYETWNTTTKTGTNASPERRAVGAFPGGSNNPNSFTTVFQVYSSTEIRAIVIFASGGYQVTLGYYIPVSRAPNYDRSLYNYYVLIDPTTTNGSLVLPPRNPWSANLTATPVTPVTITTRDAATLEIPVLRGTHLFTPASGAAIGGLSSDFALMPVSPIVGSGDRIVDSRTGEFFRPISFSTTFLTFGVCTNG